MPSSSRVLILAPTGRDAAVTAELLSKAGVNGEICESLEAVLARLREGTAPALFLAEEALYGRPLTGLRDWVAAQPAWSDLPIMVLTSRLQDTRVSAWRKELVSSLGNVSLLERPVHPINLTSLLRTAIRARARQYQVRDLLDARERAAQDLADKVREATDELRRQMSQQARIEDALRQAQKLEALGQLTGGVAHDFNNLLMIISAGVDLIQRGKGGEPAAAVIDGMRNAVKRGASLTRQLLTFARRQPLKAEVLDIERHLGGMRDLLDRSLGGNVRLEMQFGPDLWPIKVDSAELELTLLNLAFNARDAMPAGGTITVEATNVADWHGTVSQGNEDLGRALRGDFVRLSVTDTGTGMTPEVMSRAFEPFFTTKEVGKGSGLGLAQAYGFARGSGGLLEIDSELGRGTRIVMMFPRSAEKPAADAPTEPSVKVEARSEGRRVLLVEDDVEVAHLVTNMLGELGYQVLSVQSATAALGALANDRQIDLVFSDIMMPGGMDGVDLAREIHLRRPELPVVLTSGYVDAAKNDIERASVRVLSKPYDIRQLKGALTRAFEVHGVRA